MADLKLVFACNPYDRIEPLRQKKIKPEGIDLEVVSDLPPRELFDRFMQSDDFDLAEFSSSEHIAMTCAGEKKLVAIPVFPSKVFRHGFITINKNKGIKSPKDLEGRTIGGPANDGALKLFPAFSKVAQFDAAKVNVSNMAPNLREQMLLRGQVDGVFGFINTIWFSALLVGIDPAKDLRFINYGNHGMDLYSNTILFSRNFVRDNPKAVEGFVRALNRALKDVVANPEAGMDAVMKREPLLKRDLEKDRLFATLKQEMSHPEIANIGFGDIDVDRMKRAISIVVESNNLPRTPAVEEIFNRSFLPPKADRLTKF